MRLQVHSSCSPNLLELVLLMTHPNFSPLAPVTFVVAVVEGTILIHAQSYLYEGCSECLSC